MNTVKVSVAPSSLRKVFTNAAPCDYKLVWDRLAAEGEGAQSSLYIFSRMPGFRFEIVNPGMVNTGYTEDKPFRKFILLSEFLQCNRIV